MTQGHALLLVALTALGGPATAASFSCARVNTAAERAICADPALGRADERIASAHKASLGRLSPAGAAALRIEQRHWLGWTERQCRPGGLAFVDTSRPQTFAHCLTETFQARGQALQTAVTTAGGMRFLMLNPFRRRRTGPSDDGNLAPVETEAAELVRIDAPATAAARRWNLATERLVARYRTGPMRWGRDNGPGSIGIGVTVASASTEAIFATVARDSYYGGAHPAYDSMTLAWSLRLGRALAAADLFARPTDPALRRLVHAHLHTGGRNDAGGCGAPEVARSKFVADRTGVVFQYDPYELGGYPCGGESRLSWVELRPFLKRPLPLDPARLEGPRPVVAASRAR